MAEEKQQPVPPSPSSGASSRRTARLRPRPERDADQESLNLERRWSSISDAGGAFGEFGDSLGHFGDAGGAFGGDGGMLQRNPSQASTGWLERLDRQPSERSTSSRRLDRTPSRPSQKSRKERLPPPPSSASYYSRSDVSTLQPSQRLDVRQPEVAYGGLPGHYGKPPEVVERMEMRHLSEGWLADPAEEEEEKKAGEDDVEPAGSGSGSSVEESDPFQVQWDGDMDPENPKLMSHFRKWVCTYVVSAASTCVTCTSSVYTPAIPQIMERFHAAELLVVAGLSLFVMGLGIGPMFLAPLSEFYGRRPVYLVSFFFFTVFLVPCAVAPNITVLLIFRFLTGMAGSAFLSVAGGTVGDMFARHELGPPMMIYTASPFVGPEIGPLVGGFINQNVNWRWTFYVFTIWSGVMLVLLYFCVPETYHPVLLRQKAQRLRKETGDDRFYAQIERMEKSILSTVLWSCLRPFQLLFWEPMLLLLCLFTALLLGVLYLFFEAFPLVFENVHGFSLQMTGLTFLGMMGGMVANMLTSGPTWGRYYAYEVSRAGKAQPEFRLLQSIFGSGLVTIGLFWFAWTTFKSVHWIVPIIGSGFFAAGMLQVYGGVFTFLVDAYPLYAASALAANSFVRSSFAAGFPLFGDIMYEKLGYQWAGSLLAFLTVPMAPTMWLFYRYGEKIRKKSRFAGGKV